MLESHNRAQIFEYLQFYYQFVLLQFQVIESSKMNILYDFNNNLSEIAKKKTPKII